MKKFAPSIASILSGVLLIVIGFKLDQWIDFLARISRREFRPQLNWMAPAYFADIFMVSLLLAWLWFTHRKVERNRVVAFVYVVLGAGLLIYTLVVTFISFDLPAFVIYFYIAPNSSASFASAFLIIFGLQRLIFGQSAI